MNVRVIPGGAQPGDAARPAGAGEPAGTGGRAPDGVRPARRAPVVPERDDPVSIGDRLRRLVGSGGEKEPVYPRLLRLRHVHPNGWQRAVLIEGMALVGGLAALADLATAWAPVILPVAAGVVVKFHDVIAGVLPSRQRRAPAGPRVPVSGDGSAASPARGNAAGTDRD